MTNHQLCQTKPSETEASKEVEEGLATLEQEQQLWRPGVKAEQVRESLLVLKKSEFLYFSLQLFEFPKKTVDKIHPTGESCLETIVQNRRPGFPCGCPPEQAADRGC